MRGAQNMVPYLMYQAAVNNANKHRAREEELEKEVVELRKQVKDIDYLRDTVKSLRRKLKTKGYHMSDQITLPPAQSTIFRDLFVEQTCRYAVGVCTRGFGKSYLAAVCAMQAAAELMQLPEDVNNKNVALIAPTYQQSVDIYFPLLYDTLGLKHYCEKASAYSGKFWLPNNVELRLWSYESLERMRGTDVYFVVCDEVLSLIHI